MKEHWPKVLFVVLVVAAIILAKYLLGDWLSLDHFKHNKERLLSFIQGHYIQAAVSFIVLYIGTALFLPGALALTIAGGMIFGALPTVVYANIGATMGATLAFLLARSIIGRWVQERFSGQLRRFNKEVSLHGRNYLLTLRILPIAPFFVINYFAGITHIPLKTFLWTTSVGMLPGSVIYAFVGYQLRYVNAPSDFFSWKIVLALLVLSLFSLLPVFLHHRDSRR